MKRKFISMILAVVMIASVFAFGGMTVAADTGDNNAATSTSITLELDGQKWVKNAEDVYEPATDSNQPTLTLNFTTETWTGTVTPKWSSIDGTTWKATDAKMLESIINSIKKGKSIDGLWLADSTVNPSAKDFTGAGTVWVVTQTINARPAAPKIVIDYRIGNGKFIIQTDKTKTKSEWADADIECAQGMLYKAGAATYGDNVNFIDFPTTGVALAPNMSDGKQDKTRTYFFRLKPVIDLEAKAITPLSDNSKPKATKVPGLLAAPKPKVDYKKELIKLKVGDEYVVASETSLVASPTSLIPDKDAAKAGLVFGNSESANKFEVPVGGKMYVGIRTATNIAKNKPQSAVAIVPVVGYQGWTAALTAKIQGGLDKTTGKYKAPKDIKFEAYDETKGKWGGIKLNKTGDTTLDIRVKSTAKYDAKGTLEKDMLKSGTTASELVTVTFIGGEDENGKAIIANVSVATPSSMLP